MTLLSNERGRLVDKGFRWRQVLIVYRRSKPSYRRSLLPWDYWSRGTLGLPGGSGDHWPSITELNYKSPGRDLGAEKAPAWKRIVERSVRELVRASQQRMSETAKDT
jgi:hypothetical protein